MGISERMSRIRSKDTGPEFVVRRLLYGMGYRYRLHVRKLPGSPDIVFHGRKKAIFVNGCFWHQHQGCKVAHIPKSNREFWQAKLDRNRKRDMANQDALRDLGWDVLVIWECEVGDSLALAARLLNHLGPHKESLSLAGARL